MRPATSLHSSWPHLISSTNTSHTIMLLKDTFSILLCSTVKVLSTLLPAANTYMHTALSEL